MLFKKRNGFTLVELMMVIAVIFILISLGIFTYKIVKEKQRVGIAVDQLVMIRSGMEV